MVFPSNQFRNQEPGTDAEIKTHIQKTYGVQFLMFSKTDVNGKEAHEVFKFLRKSCPELNADQEKKKGTAEIPWNYCKFIIDSEGHLVKYMDPLKEPKKAVQ